MERNAAEAARDKDWEKARRLVKQGENVNAVDRGVRRTALLYAVIWENPEVCSFLLLQGAKGNLTDNNGNQPFHAASRLENSDTRQWIRKLKRGRGWLLKTLRGTSSLLIAIDFSRSLKANEGGITADFDGSPLGTKQLEIIFTLNYSVIAGLITFTVHTGRGFALLVLFYYSVRKDHQTLWSLGLQIPLRPS